MRQSLWLHTESFPKLNSVFRVPDACFIGSTEKWAYQNYVGKVKTDSLAPGLSCWSVHMRVHVCFIYKKPSQCDGLERAWRNGCVRNLGVLIVRLVFEMPVHRSPPGASNSSLMCSEPGESKWRAWAVSMKQAVCIPVRSFATCEMSSLSSLSLRQRPARAGRILQCDGGWQLTGADLSPGKVTSPTLLPLNPVMGLTSSYRQAQCPNNLALRDLWPSPMHKLLCVFL